MNNFEKFSEEKLPNKKYFHSSVKDRKPGDNGKKLDGNISDKDYLACNKIWNKFNMTIIWKKVLLLPDDFKSLLTRT